MHSFLIHNPFTMKKITPFLILLLLYDLQSKAGSTPSIANVVKYVMAKIKNKFECLGKNDSYGLYVVKPKTIVGFNRSICQPN